MIVDYIYLHDIYLYLHSTNVVLQTSILRAMCLASSHPGSMLLM